MDGDGNDEGGGGDDGCSRRNGSRDAHGVRRSASDCRRHDGVLVRDMGVGQRVHEWTAEKRRARVETERNGKDEPAVVCTVHVPAKL